MGPVEPIKVSYRPNVDKQTVQPQKPPMNFSKTAPNTITQPVAPQ